MSTQTTSRSGPNPWTSTKETSGQSCGPLVRTSYTATQRKRSCSAPKYGHRISAKGIEADEGKVDRVKNWPCPTSAKQMRGFLGLVRYIAAFLPKLAEFTMALDELTRKECVFPQWIDRHQTTFGGIKDLVTSKDCLTTIVDPSLTLGHKIFVTIDASDTGSGAILAFGTHLVRNGSTSCVRVPLRVLQRGRTKLSRPPSMRRSY